MTSFKLKEVLCLLYSIVLFFSGFVLIGFALVLSYKLLFYHFSFIPSGTVWPFVVIFFIGVAHLLITWIGVKGPGNEHDFFIVAFIVITTVLMVVEVSVGVWSMVARSHMNATATELMTRSHIDYANKLLLSDKESSSEWVRLQSKFQCCGVNGREDYKQGPPPPSCYKCHPLNVVNRTKTCIEVYEVGCKGHLVKFVERLLLENAILSFLVGILQVGGVAIFVSFYKALKVERVLRVAQRASRVRQSFGHQPRPPPHRPLSGSSADNQHAPTAPTT